MSRAWQQNGFTTKELLMALTVIGILFLAAIPQFYSMQRAKRESDMRRVVAMLEQGIRKFSAADVDKKFPTTLDDQAAGTVCSACFSSVLDKPLVSNLWFKDKGFVGTSLYRYSIDGDFDGDDSYREPGDYEIHYHVMDGTITTNQVPR